MMSGTKRRRISREQDQAIPENDLMYDINSSFESNYSPPRLTIRYRGRPLSPLSEYASDTTVIAPNRGSPTASPINRAAVSPRSLRSPGLSPISHQSSSSRSTNRTVPQSRSTHRTVPRSRSPSRSRSPKRSPSRSSSARGRARSSGVSR